MKVTRETITKINRRAFRNVYDDPHGRVYYLATVAECRGEGVLANPDAGTDISRGRFISYGVLPNLRERRVPWEVNQRIKLFGVQTQATLSNVSDGELWAMFGDNEKTLRVAENIRWTSTTPPPLYVEATIRHVSSISAERARELREQGIDATASTVVNVVGFDIDDPSPQRIGLFYEADALADYDVF